MRLARVVFAAILVSSFLVAPGLAADKEPNVTGAWKCVGNSGGDQKMTFRLDLVQKGTTVTGSAGNDEGSVDISKGTFENGKLKLVLEAMGGEYTIEGAFEGEALKGNFSHSTGSKGTWEGTREGAKETAASTVADLLGKWKLSAETDSGKHEYTLELTRDGEKLSGLMRTEEGDEVTLAGVSYAENTLKFAVPTGEGDYEVEGKVAGKSIKGTFKAPDGKKGTWEAAKI